VSSQSIPIVSNPATIAITVKNMTVFISILSVCRRVAGPPSGVNTP
jgi:hypothetical protein